jgi:hypothetical protein
MNVINELLVHDNPVIRDLGLRAIKYKSQLEDGLLSKEEYDSLCAQLLDVKNNVVDAEEATVKQNFAEALQFLSQFLRI